MLINKQLIILGPVFFFNFFIYVNFLDNKCKYLKLMDIITSIYSLYEYLY